MNSQQIWQDFLTAVKTCFSKYFEFSGRAGRKEFWYFFLFSMAISSLFSGSDSAFGSLISLILLFPSLAVGARRLHDLDKSGYLLFVLVIPLFGWLYLLFTWAQEGTNDENRFGQAVGETGGASYEYDDSDEPMDFNYEDLPQAGEYEAPDEQEQSSEPQKDRYGRDVTVQKKADEKKKSDFLKG